MTQHLTKATSSADIFFSYKREDEDQVRKFYTDLKIRGVTSIWMDRQELAPGDLWKRMIEDAINCCQIMVVFISPLALISSEVKDEYELASKLHKVIIPLILYGSTIKDLPSILRASNLIDMSGIGYEASVIALAKTLPQKRYQLSIFRQIPAGESLMGPPKNPNTLTLPTFWMAERSVSVTQYVHFIQAGGYETDEYWLPGVRHRVNPGATWPHVRLEQYALEYPEQPMRGLSWYEALAYSQWLSLISGHPFTLPIEAQWEKAARGTVHQRWAFGDQWIEHAADVSQVGKLPRSSPKPCGIFGSSSPYDCHDMVGHVWNWTLSQDNSLPYQVEAHSLEDIDEPRIIRGGSWLRGPGKALVYHRESQSPVPEDYRYEIGLRLVTHQDPAHLFENAVENLNVPAYE